MTRRHMSVALSFALLLHAGLALWLSAPQPDPVEYAEPEPPLRINLLAMLAAHTDSAANIEPQLAEPWPESPPESPPEALPPLEPPAEPQPTPESLPEPAPEPPPEPIIEPALSAAPSLEPAAIAKPVPQPPSEPQHEPMAEAVAESVPVQETHSAAASVRYEQLLVAWLEKHKRYPRRAKRLRIEGEGILRIRIDRSGRILQARLEKRTGNRFLDKAALAMTARADPFPPMPGHDPRPQLEFRVPVLFALN